MKFKIIGEIDEEGRYVMECPDLPGCFTEGETLEEALNHINEAIVGCLTSRLKNAKENFLKKNGNRSCSRSNFSSRPDRETIDAGT